MDWINPTGARKVHSLIDKVYRQENLLMAWERVNENGGSGGVDRQTEAGFWAGCEKNYVTMSTSLSRFDKYRFQRPASRVSIARWAYQRGTTGCVNKRCRSGWSRSLSLYSMMPTSDILPFERYADDAIVHCRTEAEAQEVRAAIAARMEECRLELHQEKTKVVYCKDDDRRRRYPNEKFDFLGYGFQPRRSKNRYGK